MTKQAKKQSENFPYIDLAPLFNKHFDLVLMALLLRHTRQLLALIADVDGLPDEIQPLIERMSLLNKWLSKGDTPAYQMYLANERAKPHD